MAPFFHTKKGRSETLMDNSMPRIAVSPAGEIIFEVPSPTARGRSSSSATQQDSCERRSSFSSCTCATYRRVSVFETVCEEPHEKETARQGRDERSHRPRNPSFTQTSAACKSCEALPSLPLLSVSCPLFLEFATETRLWDEITSAPAEADRGCSPPTSTIPSL